MRVWAVLRGRECHSSAEEARNGQERGHRLGFSAKVWILRSSGKAAGATHVPGRRSMRVWAVL